MLFPLFLSILGVGLQSMFAAVEHYGYLAIFIIMTLESASFPIPSEVVLPAVGFLASAGTIELRLGFLAALLGGVAGMGIDYYVAYFFERKVVYKHLHLFHIKRQRVERFDMWFNENAAFAVFVGRLLPVVRGLISFPAGFAGMPVMKFYAYSITGTVIWDVLLIGFGYYALSISNFYLLIAAIVIFTFAMYAIYHFAVKRLGRKQRRAHAPPPA